jgi:hypothetical protein
VKAKASNNSEISSNQHHLETSTNIDIILEDQTVERIQLNAQTEIKNDKNE